MKTTQACRLVSVIPTLSMVKLVRIEGRLVKERNDLLPIDYLFFGFRSLSLFQTEFMYFNGLRITMKPPSHPCKLGLYLATNFKEYEHYTVNSVRY